MSLESLFSEAANLPNVPKVVQELIENFNNPEINASEISKKIQMDQVISAKVMRLANSARYGAGRNIASIDSAVVMLGTDTLKTLVIASGVTGAFKDIEGFDKIEFWRDCFMTANIAKLVAGSAKLDAEVGFTCGMLHNIGELLIRIHEPETEAKIDNLVEQGAKRADLQRNQYGYDYTDAGAGLAKRWKFPDEIAEAIAKQEAPLAHEDFSALSALVYIAKYLNQCVKEERSKEDILGQFPGDVGDKLGLDLVDFFEKLIALTEAEDDINELLS